MDIYDNQRVHGLRLQLGHLEIHICHSQTWAESAGQAYQPNRTSFVSYSAKTLEFQHKTRIPLFSTWSNLFRSNPKAASELKDALAKEHDQIQDLLRELLRVVTQLKASRLGDHSHPDPNRKVEFLHTTKGRFIQNYAPSC